MNNENGSIDFRVGIDNTKLQADAAKSKAALKSIGDSGVQVGSQMESAFSRAGAMATVMAAGAVASLGMLGKAVLDTTAKFEKFGIVLRNTLGDTRGNEALAMIKEFAATTPYQLDEVTAAFVKMANQGFVPTRQEMVKLGDLASSTGKSFDQLAEAILDAQTLQFERLKEFGIKASSEGDKVTFMFKEQATTVEKNNKAIQQYILSLGSLNGIMGANEKISQSLTGKISNLGDKIASMYNDIGTKNSGILYGMVDGAAAVVENYEKIAEVIKALLVVYGAQKLAIMAIAYAETAKAAAIKRNVAIEAEYNALLANRTLYSVANQMNTTQEIAQANLLATAKQRVIAAEKQMAASSAATRMINPYALAAAAVAALGYAIYKVATYQTELEKASKKAAEEIENEKDKAALLFAELKKAKEGTEEWTKARAAIISQYGIYLSEQQKELTNTKLQTEAYAAVNREIEKNILLKVKQETQEGISAKFNPKISKSTQKIEDLVREVLGRDEAAEFKFEIAPLIAKVKIAEPDDKAEAEKELNEFLRSVQIKIAQSGASIFKTSNMTQYTIDLSNSLRKFRQEMDETEKAFSNAAQKREEAPADPILTTYEKQLDEIRSKRAKALQELDDLKKNPGVDPLKEINAKKAEIAEYDKQLGIKEVQQKKERIEEIKKLMQTAHGEELTALARELVLEEAKKKVIEDRIAAEMAMARNQEISRIGPKTQTEAIDLMKKSSGLDFDQVLTGRQKHKLEIDKLNQREERITQEVLEITERQIEKDRMRAGYYYDIADSASYLASVLGQSNSELGGMLNALAGIANQFGRLQENGFKISKSDAVSLGISGATQLIAMVGKQIADNKQVMKDYYASVISQQQQYNLLLNEQIRLNSDINGSIFLKDFEGRLRDSAKAYNDAQAKFQEEFKKFAQSEAITGMKNAVSGSNILTGVGAGAAAGAAIGSVVPVIGTAIGAAAGAVIGGLIGLFTRRKKEIVAPLAQTYPELIDANGKFNTELAKTLIANNKVTEATKLTLQNLIEWEEAMEKARIQLESVITDLAGSLADDIRNALIEAFREGEDAAVAFGKSVEKVMENILANMLFNKAFEGIFKTLENEMKASYGDDGDQDWLDDLERFFKSAPGAIDAFNLAMRDAQIAGDLAGFNLFRSDTGRTGSSKGITQMSQDSADELNGRFTAIQGHTYSISEGVKMLSENSAAALKHLSAIERNTDRLEAVERHVGATKEILDSINMKGIIIKS